jgi:ParB/RepB/Spo0J family partition protein
MMELRLDQIRPSAVALRKVDTNSPKFLEIVASIPVVGILNPPNVQLKVDEETEEEYYELVDGLHRYTAAQACGLETIPVHVVEFDEINTLIAQVHGNWAKVDTKPIEFTRQLVRIMQKCPTMTEAELAEKTGFSLSLIRQRLKLDKIDSDEILSLIDTGKISLQNAYALASLPVEEQENFKDEAITDAPQAFLATVKAKNKEIKEARKAGREQITEFPGANPHLRSLKEVNTLVEDKAPIMQFVKDGMGAEEIVDAVLAYVMCVDPISQETEKAKWEAKQAQRKDKAEKSAKDKAKRKAEKAQEKAAKAQAEAEAALAEAVGEVEEGAEAPAAE